MHKFSYSPAPLKKVKHVQFGILSPDEIKEMSVCKVEFPVTFEGGKPKPGGLADTRMGSATREFPCTTCQVNGNECSGHFGHIELVKPMYHYAFIVLIVKILRCVCVFLSQT